MFNWIKIKMLSPLSELVCFVFVPLAVCQTFRFDDVNLCRDVSQFFNSANLRCESCGAFLDNSVSAFDRLECICPSNFKTISSASETGSAYFQCIDCTSPSNIACIDATPTCSARQALVRSYADNALLPAEACISCSALGSPSSQSIVCKYNAPTSKNIAFTTPQDLPYVQQQLSSAKTGCQHQISPNITACQVLANLCVLQFYNSAASACAQYIAIFDRRSHINSIGAWKQNLPMVFYTKTNMITNLIESDILLSSPVIASSFSFRKGSTVFDLVLFKYAFNGTYLGSEPASNGLLQICPDRPSVESAAFVFGTAYRQACSLTGLELGNQDNYPPVMYDLNLRFVDSTGNTVLFPIPVSASTFPGSLVRRFSLVDSFSMADSRLIHYPASIAITVNLRSDNNGTINPPVMTITYATVSTSDEDPVMISFKIDYISAVNYQAFVITLPVFGGLGLLYALLLTSSWRRRRGTQFVDVSNILMFLYFSLAMLANAFFLVMFGYAVITLLFYKNQTIIFTFLPNQEQRYFFLLFTSMAFAFKAVEVLGIIFFQSNTDIFFIDWECAKNERDGKVSIWRTYYIANRWNKIQTRRKIDFTFQLLIVLLLLEVVGFKSFATENPNGNLNQATTQSADAPLPVYNPLLRFGIASLIYVVVAVVQILYKLLFHERFIRDEIREFVDLCSVSNISVFVLANRLYGYYIHGRSVHGKADTDMLELYRMLKKEEYSLTPRRGLESNSKLQTFIIATSSHFRFFYDRIRQPLNQLLNQPSSRGGISRANFAVLERVRTYSAMIYFLSSFIDHSFRDLNYVVKDKMCLENLCETESEQPLTSTCFFYNDPQNSFTESLFYGCEFSLLIFDILLFSIIDYHISNYLLAGIITYTVQKFLVFLRQAFGRSNLAKKTLIDKRFLI